MTNADELIERAADSLEFLESTGGGKRVQAQVIRDLAAALREARAEIARLRADLVWAVRKGVMVGHDECVRPCIWFDVHRGVEYDGTPDSICRAVREARDGEADS